MDHFNSLGSRRSSHAARIELDRPGATFFPGEVLSGRLHVVAGQGPPPRSVAIELQVTAEGEVSSVGVAAEARIAAQPWSPGQRTAYPFALTVPSLPPHFSGTLFRTGTRLAAVLDEPGDRNSPLLPIARAFPIVALPVPIGAAGVVVVQPLRDAVRTVRLGPGSGRGLKLGLILVGIGALSFAVGLALTLLLGLSAMVAISAGMFGSMFLLVGGFIVWGTAGNWRAERSLGVPSVTMEPKQAEAGMLFCVTALIPNDARLVNAELRMHISEDIQVASNSAEDGGWGKKSLLASIKHPLVRTGPGRWAVHLPTASFEGAPLTIDLYGADVRWNAEVVLDVQGGARWSTSQRLVAYRGEPWAPRTTFSFT